MTTLGDIMARVAIDVPGVTWAAGTRHTPHHGSPPRVTWVPRRDEASSPRAGTETVGGRRSRSAVGLLEGFDVHCWGEDYDSTVLLRDAVLRATHALCAGSWRHQGGEWQPTGEITLGELTTVRLALMTTIFDRAAMPARVTEVGIEPRVDTPGDGILDGGLT